MKKVLTVLGCAMFVAAMSVACTHKNAEQTTDTIVEDAVEQVVTDAESVENAVEATSEVISEGMSEAEHAAMLDAAREAGRAKCNCYKTDAASVESCIKSILQQSYAAYSGNEEFKAVMEEEFNSCVKEKATEAIKEKANEGIKAGASALANKLGSKN